MTKRDKIVMLGQFFTFVMFLLCPHLACAWSQWKTIWSVQFVLWRRRKHKNLTKFEEKNYLTPPTIVKLFCWFVATRAFLVATQGTIIHAFVGAMTNSRSAPKAGSSISPLWRTFHLKTVFLVLDSGDISPIFIDGCFMPNLITLDQASLPVARCLWLPAIYIQI